MSKRKFWGWGNVDQGIPEAVKEQLKQSLGMSLGMKEFPELPVPILNLRDPRFELPASIAHLCTSESEDRANHSYGKSFRDVFRARRGIFPNPVDYVAYPKTEQDIIDLMAYAGPNNIALIPYGGGSSVVGGVEAPEKNPGCISVDMMHFDQILEIDHESRAALVQGGVYGPALERGLRPHGLTLRHFPQSFEFSTVGGWIATRGGGHFATLFTHIDDFVQSIRMVTPNGVMQTRKLPGSGAGPSEERLLTGSEGVFGIITESWIKLLEIPKFKDTKTFSFPDFLSGAKACRALAQSMLFPSNARLVSPIEAFSNGLGNGTEAVLILGFESHLAPIDHQMNIAIELVESLGGKMKTKPSSNKEKKDGAAENWKNSFLMAPYMRDELVGWGVIIETFETAITWDQFENFYNEVKTATEEAVKRIAGTGFVTCRLTHLYPDGAAPYFTVYAKGNEGQQLEQWAEIKEAASEALIKFGGTITHHHAVGRDHVPYYEKQRSAPFGNILASVKKTLDPNGIMNPGVLLRE